MSTQFMTSRRVEFSDTDMAGILHFSSYYRYMEETEHGYFRSLGLSIMHKQDDGSVIGWPRVSAACSFMAPAHFEDVLQIRLSVERRGVKSLTLAYEFWRDDMQVAKGRMKTACCLIRHGAPMESIAIPLTFDKIQEVGGSDQYSVATD